MLYCFVSFILGVVQILLLAVLLFSITGKKGKFIIPVFIAKFVLYGVAIWQLMFNYFSYLAYCSFGFMIGAILTAFCVFIYRSFIKKS